MLCGSRSAVVAAAAKTAPPESLRQSEFGARLNPATTKVLCPTARANRREVCAKVRVYLPPCLSVDAVHADDPFAILSSDLTSSFRQILHFTVARKSLVKTNCKVVVAYVTACKS